MTACGQQRSCSKQSSRGKKGSEGSSTRAAWRLQGPRLCKPIHLECSIEGLAGGRHGRRCFEGAVAQGKAAGRVRPEGRRTLAPPLGGNGIVCYKNGGKIQATINHLMHMCVLTVCACTLPCFAHACFRVLHSLYSLCLHACFRVLHMLIKIKERPCGSDNSPRASSAAS